MYKPLQICLGLLSAILMLGACTLVTPIQETVPTAEPMDEATPGAQAAQSSLINITWQWISLSDPTGNTDVSSPENYTITFQEDGTVGIKADCNSAGGSYTVDGATLSIVVGPMTLMACPADSLGDQFVQNLASAATYSVADGQLLIDMLADGGTMTFRSVPEAAEDTSSAVPAAVIEATFVCPDGTTIGAVFDNTADTVTLTLPDQTLTLPRAISGSGARYSDDTTTFWNKGNEALVEINGETVYQGCVAQEDDGDSTDAGSNAASDAAVEDIVDVTWQLVEIQYMNDTVATPADPTHYTLTLAADGSFAAQVDCNRGRGTYALDGSNLSVGEMAMTRMMCPPDSLADEYQQGLAAANSYVLEEGDLYIAFGPDTGILHFAPASE